jgi:hypothetical protein
MNRTILFACLFVAVIWGGNVEGADDQVPPSCNTTASNGIGILGNSEPGSYGNGLMSVGQWRDGTVIFRPGGPGFVTSDGGLGMKFGWRRGVRGRLIVTGRRLDAPALPLRARVPQGYGDFGFQSTYLIFSTPGCWEVTGRVGDTSLTFVTNVVKIGGGPTWRLDPEGVDPRPAQ